MYVYVFCKFMKLYLIQFYAFRYLLNFFLLKCFKTITKDHIFLSEVLHINVATVELLLVSVNVLVHPCPSEFLSDSI